MKDEQKSKNQLVAEPEESGLRVNKLVVSTGVQTTAGKPHGEYSGNLINVLNSMEDGVYIVNQDYDIEFVNTSLQNEFGPVNGKKCYEYFYDRDDICTRCKNQDVFAGKEGRRVSYSEKTKKTYDVIYTPINDPDGSISKLAIFRDITERIEAEEALKQSEERYRELFDSAGDGIFVHDLEGHFLDVNRSACKLLGYTRDELLTMTPMDITTKEHSEKVMELIQSLEEHGHQFFETALITRNNRVIAMEANSRLVNYGGNDAILTILRDLTERRRAKEMIRESEKKYHSLFESMLNGFSLNELVFDEEGNPVDHIFLEINPAFEKLTGLKRDDIIGKKATEVMPGFEKQEFDWIGTLNNVAMTGEEARFEQYTASLDRWYSVLAFSPKKNYFAVVFEDITEQRKTREALKESEAELMKKNMELKKALRVKTEFLSMVSHELRTPLVPIIGYSELLVDGLLGDIPTEAVDSVNIIKDRAQDLVKLIEDLLILTRMESGKIILDLKPINVAERVREIIADYKLEQHAKQVSVDWSGEDFTVLTDHTRIHQIFRNLIENAIKYSNETVHITFQTRSENSKGIITVSDNGIGIREDHQPRVFDRFYQVESVDIRKHGGTGLGLAITRELIEMMDGTISVSSEVGKGSTFTITLPLA